MRTRLYNTIRDLHLYLGLFVSPFILVFSVSVFFLVHAWVPKLSHNSATTRLAQNIPLPPEIQKLSGRKLIEALKPTLEAAHVAGEMTFVRHQINENKIIVPVVIPGRETTVTINTTNRDATIVSRETGLADALIILHKFPGQHVPDIRTNWLWMKLWSWLADATVYLLLFITVSGIYLWYVLRAERTIGYALIIAGALVFFGMIYGLCR